MKSEPDKSNKKLIKTEGFSLIELLIVILIVMILAAILSVLYFNTINTQKTILSEASSLTEARTALYIMEKEIREATLFLRAETNRITFKKKAATVNKDNEITYYTQALDENNYILKKEQGSENEATVIKNLISDNIFSFYYKADSDSIGLPMNAIDLNNFKILKISLTIGNNLKENNKNLVLSSSVYLRNR